MVECCIGSAFILVGMHGCRSLYLRTEGAFDVLDRPFLGEVQTVGRKGSIHPWYSFKPWARKANLASFNRLCVQR